MKSRSPLFHSVRVILLCNIRAHHPALYHPVYLSAVSQSYESFAFSFQHSVTRFSILQNKRQLVVRAPLGVVVQCCIIDSMRQVIWTSRLNDCCCLGSSDVMLHVLHIHASKTQGRLSLVHWTSSQIRKLLDPVFLQFHFKCNTSTLFLSLIPLFRACESTVNRIMSIGLQTH
jgi:hypothetical protein